MTTITAATINLRNRADRWRERRHLLVAQLVDAAPDLISLQEIYFPITQGNWLRNQINNRLTGTSKRPYHLIQKRKAHPIHGYYEGIGVLTKLPIFYSDAISLGYGGRIALRVNVELPNRQALDFVAVHLHHERHGQEARLEQAIQLVGWVNGRRRIPRQIIAGDFNDTPDSLAIRYLRQSFRSAFAEKWGREPLATFPTALAQDVDWAACLDYLFLSPGAGVVKNARLFCHRPAENDDTLYPSDHAGLLIELDVS